MAHFVKFSFSLNTSHNMEQQRGENIYHPFLDGMFSFLRDGWKVNTQSLFISNIVLLWICSKTMECDPFEWKTFVLSWGLNKPSLLIVLNRMILRNNFLLVHCCHRLMWHTIDRAKNISDVELCCGLTQFLYSDKGICVHQMFIVQY